MMCNFKYMLAILSTQVFNTSSALFNKTSFVYVWSLPLFFRSSSSSSFFPITCSLSSTDYFIVVEKCVMAKGSSTYIPVRTYSSLTVIFIKHVIKSKISDTAPDVFRTENPITYTYLSH